MTRYAIGKIKEYIISTHTLTWSVTSLRKLCVIHCQISTHTLTWSVTFKDDIPFIYRNDFNSHAHVERDYKSYLDFFAVIISTHTLTWSVTARSPLQKIICTISTHTLTWSVTTNLILTSSPLLFQLTRSRGA